MSRLIESIIYDIRYAARTLYKSIGFTATSVTVLSLAIGATTAMFSVLDGVLLRPLPFPFPEQLAMLWTEIPSQNVREGRTAYWNVEQWRLQSKSFSDMAVFDPASVTLTSADQADRVGVLRVTRNLFSLLGVRPVRGRIFSSEEAEQRQRVALISDRFWKTRFGRSDNTIGATIQLDGVPTEIIGIVSALSDFPQFDSDVWEPHTVLPDWEAARTRQGVGSWFVVARLQPNVTFDQAQGEMNAIGRRLDEEVSASQRNLGITVVPLNLQVTGSRSRLILWMLMAAVVCVLLIAAINIASLTLARSAGREKEIAIRAAIGASRVRIARQLLAESVTLAGISGLLGLVVARMGIHLIRALKPIELARLDQIGLDLHVLICAMVICLLTGIVVGFAPAITMARRNLSPSVKEAGRGVSSGMAARGIRRALVVAEFALSIILLVGAGLLIRSLWSVENVDPGFRPERVLSVQLSTPPSTATPQRVDFYNRVLEQIESEPGVESAGLIGDLFIGGNPEQIVTVEGELRTTFERLRFRRDEVSNAFFRTVGTPLLRGRIFSIEDRSDSPRVAIINEVMARRLWAGRDPLGKRFKLGAPDSDVPWFTVVGVAGNMRRQGLENEPIPQMFEPLAQNPSRLATLLVRTSVNDPLETLGAIRAAVQRVDKYAPFYDVTTLDNRLGGFLAQRRFLTSMLIGFSLVALSVAAIGIYGLIQYSIATRTREIGIRMAVGATAGEIFRMIIREGLKLSLTGAGLGLLGALWVGRAGSSLLFHTSEADPLTFVTVSLLLTAVATAACYLPARRAMKVEPTVALRQE